MVLVWAHFLLGGSWELGTIWKLSLQLQPTSHRGTASKVTSPTASSYKMMVTIYQSDPFDANIHIYIHTSAHTHAFTYKWVYVCVVMGLTIC